MDMDPNTLSRYTEAKLSPLGGPMAPAASGESVRQAAPPVEGPAAPPVPDSLEATGLSHGMIDDLILRTLYVQGARSGDQLRSVMRLPFAIIDEHLLFLQRRRLLEVQGTQGHSRAGYIFDLTGEGRARAREAMEGTQYVGPAPVPLEHYRQWVLRQTIRKVQVTRERIRDGFGHLVLSQDFLDQLGPAINSGRSLFLYGPAGNGKTTLAEAIARMLGGDIYLPYAIEVEGQIVLLYDPVHHRDINAQATGDRVEVDPSPWLRPAVGHDARYALVARPVVMVGGELTLEQLELQYDTHSKVYRAPAQVQANGGVFIIDDFGRQRARPRDLLNRWMIPLERHIDFLTLRNGHKFPVPFDCMLIFATNLNPNELVEEAFLRRIRYKILVGDPEPDQYEMMFKRMCEARAIEFDPEAVAYIYTLYYERLNLEPRGCHPRDIVDHLCDTAKYIGTEPNVSIDMIDRACRSYFLDMPAADSLIVHRRRPS
jgi:energy-coupling factor transporter ATP-binding protein EcfA2